jgi:hypothetical protein
LAVSVVTEDATQERVAALAGASSDGVEPRERRGIDIADEHVGDDPPPDSASMISSGDGGARHDPPDVVPRTGATEPATTYR